VLQLADATGGELPLSARYRSLYAPAGYGHELRVAFRTGDACWAVACLARAAGEPEFDAAELDFVAAVATDVGRGVRTALLTDRRTAAVPRRGGAGMLVLDAEGTIESLTDEAERWLAELPADGLELPGLIYEVAERSRSGPRGAPARARVRSSSGTWLVVEGARLDGTEQASVRTAIVIQPANRGDLAPLLAVAYGLTEREQELAQLLARGLAIERIATGMGISRYTVRDHVKAIYAKLGVTSRAELTALLFYERVLPAFERQIVAGSRGTAP
jgi:DNA-binding CsgD family transcriptional regulator